MAPHINTGEYQHVNPLLVGLLGEEPGEDAAPLSQSDEVTNRQAWCLYLSHFLSMWNSRTYEFGAVSTFLHLLFSA